jgi:AcrR family transcriptional regulator
MALIEDQPQMVRKATGAHGLGRPRQFDPNEALEAARSVFCKFGYAGSSLPKLEAASGLTRPSLYAAFGNKHALFMAALDKSRSEALNELNRLLCSDAPLPALLASVYAKASGVYRGGSSGPWGSFMTGSGACEAATDLEARAVIATFLKDVDATFGSCFARRSGELRLGVTAQGAALVAAATLHSMAVRARAGADEACLGLVASEVITLICGVQAAAPAQGKRT